MSMRRRSPYHTVLLIALAAACCPGAEPMSRDETLNAALASLPTPDVFVAPGSVELHYAGGPAGRLSPIETPGRPGPRAFRIETLEKTENTWAVQATTRIDHAVAKGDALLAVFRIRNPRGADGHEALAELVVERAGEPWEKLTVYPVRTTGDWELHYVPLRAIADFGAGEWQLLFRAGFGPQAVEVADVRLLHFGRKVKLADLPRVPRIYEGIAPDAAWRIEAARRIDRFRKADLRITVTDANDRPVPGATVKVQMTRHAFLFGSAAKLHWIADFDNVERDPYRRHIEELFNHVVNENDLKWPAWESDWGRTYSRDGSVAALKWLKRRGMHIKGHCVVWPSWQHTPARLKEASDRPDDMRRIIAEHIADVVGTAGPWVDEWDVINEPFSNHDLMDVLGRDAMVDWFAQVRGHDADARLYLNDFSILAAGGQTDTPHQQHFEDTLKFLIERGAPIGGIGMQSHFGENVTPPATLWQILDRFAKLGLPIQITEFDVSTRDEQLQAAYTRDFMTAVFAHEAVDGFVMWGFYEGGHWRPDAAMYRTDWSIKPNGLVYRQLVFDDWWTRASLTTDAGGEAVTRGFLGSYDITVSRGDRSTTQRLDLERAGATVTIKLPD